jgi:hypothetical protein
MSIVSPPCRYWGVVRACKKVSEHWACTAVVVGAILTAAVLAGLELQSPGNTLTAVGEPIVLTIFVAEVVLKV